MGILDTVGKIAGAVAAVEATEKVDPDASFLTKGIAAVGGFEAAGALEGLLEKKKEDEETVEKEDGDPADPAQA